MNKNIDLELAEIGDKQTDTKWTQVCYTVEVKTEGKPVWRWARNWLGIDRRFHTYAEAAKALNKNYVSKQVKANYRVVQVVTTYEVVENFEA